MIDHESEWYKALMKKQARDLGFNSYEEMRHAQLAANIASDDAQPFQDFAAKAFQDAESNRARVAQVRSAGAKGSAENTNAATDRLALGRRLNKPGMSGTQLRKVYSKEGVNVSQRTAERDLQIIRSDKN